MYELKENGICIANWKSMEWIYTALENICKKHTDIRVYKDAIYCDGTWYQVYDTNTKNHMHPKDRPINLHIYADHFWDFYANIHSHNYRTFHCFGGKSAEYVIEEMIKRIEVFYHDITSIIVCENELFFCINEISHVKISLENRKTGYSVPVTEWMTPIVDHFMDICVVPIKTIALSYDNPKDPFEIENPYAYVFKPNPDNETLAISQLLEKAKVLDKE